MTSLPKYVALQSKYNQKYLQFVQQEEELHGFLRFSGDGAVSPYTKFEVQVSESDNNLVHLRSCYNNKYWVPSSDNDSWVLAEADEPEEDQTKPSCTLFKPTYVDETDSSSVRFMHVNLQKYAVLMNTPGEVKDSCLYLDSGSNQDQLDVCTVIDWSSLVILPRNVAFKGGEDGKYICARPANSGVRYLQFVAEDLTDLTTGQEVFATSDGSVSIRSDSYEKFWTRTTSSYVLADTEVNDVTDRNILFSPTLIQENVIALKSVGNNDYCKAIDFYYPSGEHVIAVSAADATITAMSRLEYVERVTSKSVNVEVSDVRVSDVRVTVPKRVILVYEEVVNKSDKPLDVVVNLSFDAETLTRTWSSTVNGSLKVGESISISSPIPVEVNGQIEMTGMIVGDFVWGVGEAKSQTPTEKAYNVIVPAATKATVSAMGLKRLWDVPFSYSQTNTLYDGTKTTFVVDDGIYTGTHTLFEDYTVEFAPIT